MEMNIRLPYDIWLLGPNERKVSETILWLTDDEVDEINDALSGNLELQIRGG